MDTVPGPLGHPALSPLVGLVRAGYETEVRSEMEPEARCPGCDQLLAALASGRLVQRHTCGGGPALVLAPLSPRGFLVAEDPGLEPDRRHRLESLLAWAAHVDTFVRPESDQPTPTSAGRTSYGEIMGASQPMQEVYRLLDKVVASESTVLIGGESGTGKELVARAIHYGGPRKSHAFVVQNCSAFNDNLLESALFGHARGSFTGAVKDKKGLFEVAHRGTFFLDEIGDMSAALQVKLLRVLQEGVLTPVGSNESRSVDVRVIAATHKDLAKEVEAGRFREDLYYRINVIRIVLPPLRDRPEDIALLLEHFFEKHRRKDGKVPQLSTPARRLLMSYAWPGNVRELENEVERLTVLGGHEEELGAELLSPRIRDVAATVPGSAAIRATELAPGTTLKDALETVEKDIIAHSLERADGNTAQAARELGVSRSTLLRRCEHYGLGRKE